MSKRANEVKVQLPPIVNAQGATEQRGTIAMLAASKAPALRFKPGTIVRLDGTLWEVLYAFRFANEPTVWRYRCEQRDSLSARAELPVPEGTPRVVKEIFRNHADRESFFAGIPAQGYQLTFTTQSLLQGHVQQEEGKS